jgi:hypothetical protein
MGGRGKVSVRDTHTNIKCVCKRQKQRELNCALGCEIF